MPYDKPRLFSPDGAQAGNPIRDPGLTEGGARPVCETSPDCGLAGNRDVAFLDPALESTSDEELGLAAELQVLAAHLRGEADLLGSQYAPPETAASAAAASAVAESFAASSAATGSTAPRVALPAAPRPMRRWLWQGVAVAMIGVAISAWQIERLRGPRTVGAAAPAEQMSDSQKSASSKAAETTALAMRSRSNSPAPTAAPAAGGADAPESTASRGTLAEVGIEGPPAERHPPSNPVEMLRLQVSGFEKVIQKLQTELMARDASQIESQRRIESLEAEVASLRQQLAGKPASDTSTAASRLGGKSAEQSR